MISPEFSVQSSRGEYHVHFIPRVAELASVFADAQSLLVIIDEKVNTFYHAELSPVLRPRPFLSIVANEDEKTLEGCARVLTFLQSQNASRETTVLAIGGGVIQDIATFCTHVYYRGLRWLYIPTTLLGMADSCIGAKASINFNGYKNQLGVFHSPSEVYICEQFLASVPDKELRSGYGEIVKLHLAGAEHEFSSLVETLGAKGLRNSEIGRYIFTSLQVKKRVIEVDEFDNGVRRTLNYGHTFGHALEAITDHEIPHGLAIAWGMDLVNFIAYKKSVLPSNVFALLHEFLAAQFSCQTTKSITADALLDATRRDKKIKSGKLTLILLRSIGALDIFPQPYTDELKVWIQEYLETYSIVTTVSG